MKECIASDGPLYYPFGAVKEFQFRAIQSLESVCWEIILTVWPQNETTGQKLSIIRYNQIYLKAKTTSQKTTFEYTPTG